jgi:hypothetical protein
MKIQKMLLTIILVLVSSLPEIALSETKKIIITHLDAGGNAAAYGLTYLNGPSNRTQFFACPRNGSGLLPTGITQCSTTFESSVLAEWQPGDTLTASASPQTTAEVPYELRSGDVYLCSVTFVGWSGPCQGLGTLNKERNLYQCSFTLPQSGNVEIGAYYSGTDFRGNPCVPIPNPYPVSTPLPNATPTTNPSDDPSGNKLLDALNKAADEFADNLKLRDIIRGTAKFLLPKNADFTYDASITVRAVSEGTIPARGLRDIETKRKVILESIRSKPVILSGKGKSSLTKSKKIRLPSTTRGIKVAKNRSTLGIQVVVTSKSSGKTIPKVTIRKVIYK